jgi:hypothetical protein
LIAFGGALTLAQERALQYWNPNDLRSLNEFETTKEDTVGFTGLKVLVGGAFAQQYQNIHHSNEAVAVFNASGTNLNQLKIIGGGFNLATANLNIDAQLTDGIRLNLVTYLSSRNHQEAWVKGGYVQIDKMPFFKSELIDKIMNSVTIKMGHMEINYGDAHFRRTDNGNAFFNPFVGNYIMDAFTTEIAGEVYYHTPMGLFGMVGLSGGEIKGDITNPDNRAPSYYFKGGWDKQLNDNMRFRLTGSLYTTKKSASNTLFGGDRAGSRYYIVMENVNASTTPAFSGRWNPGMRSKITSFTVNPFVQIYGFDFFVNYEKAMGRASNESENREASQFGVEGVYRFLNNKLFAGIRYNTIQSELTGSLTEITINRIQASAGWYVTRNLLLKGEYVNQQYKDFTNTSIFYNGEFDGFVIEAVVAF